MVVKVLIKRKFKEGKSREALALLKKFRADAMDQPGYISGETLFDYDDPHKNLVIGMWQSIENWLAWKDNDIRKANEALLERCLEGPAQYETYILGTYLRKK